MTRSSEERVGLEVKQEEAGASNERQLDGQQQSANSHHQPLICLPERQQPTGEPAAERRTLANSQTNSSSPNQQQHQQHNQANKPKRNPFCSRCRNHGKIAQVKGHKRHCDYRDCQCEGCKLVECRQIVSARQIKLRRYQKQDEEYGRRIEVSPPVRRSDSTTNESMIIFAKTLMGATSPTDSGSNQFKQRQHNPSSASLPDLKRPDGGGSGRKQQSTSTCLLPTDYPNIGEPPLINARVNNCGVAAIRSGSSHRHQPYPTAHRPRHAPVQHANQPLLSVAAPTAEPGPGDSTLNPALAIPFHLFNLPAPGMLSQAQAAAAAAAAASLCTKSTPLPNTPSPSWTSCTDTLAALHTRLAPSIQEQINLVDEIHHTYGSLAIYAWLKYEQFDVEKIRDLIELSRSSYDNLLNLKLMSHLSRVDSQNQHQQQQQSTNSLTSAAQTTSFTRMLHNQLNSPLDLTSPIVD